MTDIPALVAWLRGCLDEDEAIAREASRFDYQEPIIDGGASWQWENPVDDTVINVDPLVDEYVGDGMYVSLRSEQEHDTGVGPLPQMAIPAAEEVPAAVGMHIARWDPAAVLADVDAKRRVLNLWDLARDVHRDGLARGGGLLTPITRSALNTAEAAARALARAYRGRAGWQEGWE